LLSAGDASAYPFVLQRVPEPVGVIATILEQPVDLWQAAEQRPRADVVASVVAALSASSFRLWRSVIEYELL
jgi:hypothetical protein